VNPTKKRSAEAGALGTLAFGLQPFFILLPAAWRNALYAGLPRGDLSTVAVAKEDEFCTSVTSEL
jgi:hypothetical protein